MMFTFFFCPLLILFSFAFGSAAPLRDPCEDDTQCHPGYCYMPTGYCAACTDCKVYNRNKSSRFCAKTPTECGTCLPGFEEDILAGGRVRDWCIKSAHQTAAHHSVTVQSTHNFLLWPLAIGFLITLTLFYAVCAKNWKRGVVNQVPTQADEPPPYSSLDLPPTDNGVSSSSAISNNEDVSCCDGVNRSGCRVVAKSLPRQLYLSWQQSKEVSLQQAVPFRYPEDSLQHSSNPLLDSDDELDGSDTEGFAEAVTGASSPEGNIELEDETTMPSDWVPFPVHPTNHEEPHEQYHSACDDADSVNVETAAEPPTKKRKEDDETAASPETADE